MLGNGLAPSVPGVAAVPQAQVPLATTKHKVYWTLFAGSQYPQVEIGPVPLTKKSKVVNVGASAKNNLLYTSGVAFHDNRIWIIVRSARRKPDLGARFDLPLKDTSVPRYAFVLGKSSGADAIASDPSGHLWISSATNHDILEYKGPFTKSRTLKPMRTINGGNFTSYAIAIDKNATLYVSIVNGSSTESIAVEKP